MTTIKSTAGTGRELIVSNHHNGNEKVGLRITDPDFRELLININTADLAAALGLVTREELDRKQAAWENECGNLEMTQRERDALRADLREADRARDAACDTRDELAAELTQWQQTAAENEHEANDLRAELAQANAALGRVRALSHGDNELIHASDLAAALDPKPAFVLPTEAGVRFTAKRVGNLAHTSEFVTITDGDGTAFYYIPDSLDGYGTEHHIWPGDRVMREWTGHRLIGAES